MGKGVRNIDIDRQRPMTEYQRTMTLIAAGTLLVSIAGLVISTMHAASTKRELLERLGQKTA